jgi:hypothetical protein
LLTNLYKHAESCELKHFRYGSANDGWAFHAFVSSQWKRLGISRIMNLSSRVWDGHK